MDLIGHVHNMGSLGSYAEKAYRSSQEELSKTTYSTTEVARSPRLLEPTVSLPKGLTYHKDSYFAS